jgi:DNA-binding transcriptional LysR family regulator
MKLEQLARYDIKLLVALQVLLEEESVSRAAVRLCVTQSAMSKMLVRLEDSFGEELFLRTSHGVTASDRARALTSPLNDVLDALGVLLTPTVFKPAQCERTFRITMLDNLSSRVMPGLLRTLSEQAPMVSVHLKSWNKQSFDDLASGQLDLALNVVDVDRANFYQLKLADIDICGVVRKTHPLANKQEILLDDFLAYSFIKVVIPEFNENQLKDRDILSLLGKQRKVVFETNNGHCALQSLVKTDYIMFGAKGPNNDVFESMGLTTIPVPKELTVPRYSMKFIWHQRQNLPEDQRWFRQLLVSELAASQQN